MPVLVTGVAEPGDVMYLTSSICCGLQKALRKGFFYNIVRYAVTIMFSLFYFGSSAKTIYY